MEFVIYIGAAVIIGLLLYCLYLYQDMENKALKAFEDKTQLKIGAFYRLLKDKPDAYRYFSNAHNVYWVEFEKKEIEVKITSSCKQTDGYGIYAVNNPKIAKFSYNIDEKRKFLYVIVGNEIFDFENCNLRHHPNDVI